MQRTIFLSLVVLGTALLLGCSDSPAPNAASPAPTPASSASAPANASDASAPVASTAHAAGAWVGQWNGPEGTFLRVTRQGAAYALTIANLDGPRDFQATATSDGLRFERNGVQEAVRAGTGPDTGMKWLTDKKDCLVVKAGEGYCRD